MLKKELASRAKSLQNQWAQEQVRIAKAEPQGHTVVGGGSSLTGSRLQLSAPAGLYPLKHATKSPVSLVINAPIDDETELVELESKVDIPIVETVFEDDGFYDDADDSPCKKESTKSPVSLVINAPIDDETELVEMDSQIDIPIVKTVFDEEDGLYDDADESPCKEEPIDLFPNHPDYLSDKIAQLKADQVEEIKTLHAETLHWLQCNQEMHNQAHEDDKFYDTWEELTFSDSFTFEDNEDNDDVFQDCYPNVIAGRTY